MPGDSQAKGRSTIHSRIQAARAGSGSALGTILSACTTMLTRRASRLIPHELRSKVRPSSVVSLTFIQAVQNFSQFQGDNWKELRGWLATILECQAINACRRFQAGKRDVRLEESLDPGLAVGSLSWRNDEKLGGLAWLERKERQRSVQAAVSTLASQQQLILHLRIQARMRWGVIGKIVGCSKEAARQKFLRALAVLRDRLGDFDD